MIEIHVHNVVSQVYGADPGTEAALDTFLAYRPPGYVFMPLYKNGGWDGWKRLYWRSAPGRPFGKFPTGLISRVSNALAAVGRDFRVLDQRIKPRQGDPIQINLERFPQRQYQQAGVDTLIDCTRGIGQFPTSAGKTLVAAVIQARLNIPSFFLAHKIDLVKQARDEFRLALGQEIGIIQANNIQLCRFNVATVQTLSNLLKSGTEHPEIRSFVQNDCGLVFVDEAHHSRSRSYMKVLNNFLSAYYRFGLSATPHNERPDDMEVEGLFGRIIYKIDRTQLEEEGAVSRMKAFFV